MGEITDKLVIESHLVATVEARRWAAQHARAAGFDPDAVFAIELAIGEALANVIEHSYEGKTGQEIHLTLTIDEAKLCLSIRDFGRKFDKVQYRPPNLNVPTEGGYGVYLIRRMMDEVNYIDPEGQGTQLDLVKYKSD
ncbi:MAG: ATP-binding protein [Anaerolineae bacterium]|nr:ATP-binding protein [Anaerolineae bacterium]